MDWASCQSLFDPCDFSSDDEESWTPNNVTQMTPGQSDPAACSLSTARLDSNSLPEAPKNQGKNNPNHNDYHSDPMEITSTFRFPHIANWWRQQEETHFKYAELSNVACDIPSIIPHGVGVESSFSISRDVIGWRQSKTTGETLCENVIARHTLSTWWCSCISIVRKISIASTFVGKDPPWRATSKIECPPNSRNQPSSSRKWLWSRTWNHLGHWRLASLGLRLRYPKWQRR